MKSYQDTETGKLHAFEDEVEPVKLNNRNIPTTLSETVIPQPSDEHVWFNGGWVMNTEVPEDYKEPISSVPAYNPAWVTFLKPYTAIVSELKDKIQISVEQINFNSYDEGKLPKVVATLPLVNSEQIDALITYDGAIAIPRSVDYPSSEIAIDKLNYIICAILLGGIHGEVITPQDLTCGSLENKENIFVYTPSLHTRLRHKWSSISERIQPLMYPRVLHISDLKSAYLHGLSVIEAISNFSSFFLLHGYSAMVHHNRSDALNNLWIVIEQLTVNLWENHFYALSNPNEFIDKFKKQNEIKKELPDSIWVKHEILKDSKIITEDCYVALSAARKKRNDLVHEGIVPDYLIIENLWKNIHELFETASGVPLLNMRQLAPLKSQELGYPQKYNFDEWDSLSKKL